MRKRLIIGLIVVFLALAGQDVFFSVDMAPVPTPEVSPLKSDFNKTTDSPTVTRIIDGDTIVVINDGVSEKVRLIGIDTPETVDPRKPVQCFGKEASAFTNSLLIKHTGQSTVRLESDASQGDRDKYGRLLRYVFLEDGTFVNQKILAEGYGFEYTYRTPYKYRDDFKNAERSARESQKGLWANGACGLQNTK